MKKKFSRAWKSSKSPKKQRKYRYQAPLHIKQKFVHVHLDKELRKKYKRRAVQLRKGDKVKILCGAFKKRTETVERIDLKREKVYLSNITKAKKEGTKVKVPIHPSNLMIVELNLEDKKRKAKMEKKMEK